ncbi:hypothetical protein EDC01DRAFT_498523 [Geopyxis carbonaria]|nr:hypothetical protein EDC01DRAFT_498523 [Geopyxis carbonaria]
MKENVEIVPFLRTCFFFLSEHHICLGKDAQRQMESRQFFFTALAMVEVLAWVYFFTSDCITKGLMVWVGLRSWFVLGREQSLKMKSCWNGRERRWLVPTTLTLSWSANCNQKKLILRAYGLLIVLFIFSQPIHVLIPYLRLLVAY